MKKLIEFFGQQGLFADLSTLFVIVIGIYSMTMIERKVMPNVEFEWVTVSTAFPGASAEEVERLITNPLEQELKEVEGIKKMKSTSLESLSIVNLQLDPDQTTVGEGKSDIQDVVERFNDLPEDAEDPEVVALESNLEPVIITSVSSHLPEADLRYAAKEIERFLERVPGVAKVTAKGLRDIEFRVEALPQKLQKYQLTLNDLIRALDLQNANVPGGVIEAGGSKEEPREIIVRTVGKLVSVDDVKQTVVRANALGEAIYVKDVAFVEETYEKAKILLHTNGVRAMHLTVIKKAKADAIDVVDGVKARMKELEGSLKEGISYSFVNDSSYYIRRRLNVLSGNFQVGLALVFIILALVLPFRVSLITAVGIPFAFLGTIYIMDEFDVSFNVITVMGLIIVVGMLVDDAVVVTENIVRYLEKGLEPMQAAIKGAQEIWAPVTASILTTVMAFIPMLTMTGIFGKFIRYIPIAVILALAISLYECFFILPHHMGKWVGPSLKKKKKSKFSAPLNAVFDRFVVNGYLKVLRVCVKYRYGVLVLSVLVLVGTISVAFKKMQFVLFPRDGVEAFVVRAEAPMGTSLAKTLEYIKPIEDEIAKLPSSEMDDFTTSVGEQGVGIGDPQRRRGTHFAQVMVYLTPEMERQRTAEEISESIRKNVGELPRLKRFVISQINPGPPTGEPVDIGVHGRDYSQIMEAVKELKELVAEQPGVYDIQDSFSQGKEEIQVQVDYAEAAAAGLSVTSIGQTVRAAYEGIVATTIRLLDEEIDVRVSLPVKDRSSQDSLGDILIPNQQNRMVPLKRVAQFVKGTSISQFDHQDNRREVRVVADIKKGVSSSSEVSQAIIEKFPELKKKYPGLDFIFGGEAEDTNESLDSLIKTGITAILGIFLILVLTFKNIYQPFLVVLTIPMGVIAIIWAFAARGMPLSFLGVIGMVALGGVIVNNAIVFIDFINKQRGEGLDRRASIIEAGRMRIRPIFLSTLTTVCGILPTAYGWGGLDQFVVPVATALGWGLFFGSIQVVLVVPALVAIQDDVLQFLRKLFKRASQVETLS